MTETILPEGGAQFAGSVSIDNVLAFTQCGLTCDLWVVPLSGERKPRVFVANPAPEFGPEFSPDGKWLAYTAAPTAALQAPDRGVFVRPFPASGSVYQAPRQIVDFHPVWSRDGRELIYVTSATAGQMTAVAVKVFVIDAMR